MVCYLLRGEKKGGENMKNKKGFTLVELLVVVAIIGLLSTLAVVALGSARQKARDAKRVSDIKQIQTALELYFSDQNTYPVVAAAVTLGDATHLTLSSTNAFAAAAAGTTYMGLVPSNPTPNGTAYTYTSLTAAGAACTSSPCPNYSVTFTLEGPTGGLTAGLRTAGPNGIL